MLVVMENGNAQSVPELPLDIEAIGRADVLKVDPTDGRLEELAEPDHILRVLRAHLEVEHVDVGERLEEDALALHYRLSCQRADVSQAEDCGSIGDDGDEVTLGGVDVGIVGAFGDLQARLCDPRGVREGKVSLILERLCWRDLDLPRAALGVIVEGLLAAGGQEQKSFFEKGLC